MKIFIQKLLINYALIFIANAVLYICFFGISEQAKFSIELFLVMVVLRLLMLLTDKFQSRWPVLEYLLELGMALTIVLGCGWFLGWYEMSASGYMITIIIAVYAGAYLVGIGRARQDAAFINEQIKLRRDRLKENQKEIKTQ